MDKDLNILIEKLDALSWSFRIEKSAERDCDAYWQIWFINPQNHTWYERRSPLLGDALSQAVDVLTEPPAIFKTGS